MPIDPSIPLQAQGSPDNFGKLMQVAQVQQMNQAQQQKRNELREHKRIKAMADRGTGLFLRYQTLKENGFSEQAAHAAMQEDWGREIGGLGSLRDDDGSALFSQDELGQFGKEFDAGQLGSVLPKLVGAERALELHFKQREMSASEADKKAAQDNQAATLAETRRHNKAVEGAPKAGQRPVATADAKSPTGFTYETPEGAVGKPAPAPRANTNTKYSAKETEAARNKVRMIGVARQQLDTIKEKWQQLTAGGGAVSAGPFGAGRLPTEAGSNFDAAVDQFRSTITSLTRTPGVGAMSDYEAKLDQSKLPSRRDYESSTAQKIADLESFINNLDSGYADIVGEGQMAAPGAGANEQDILDAADAILNGQ